MNPHESLALQALWLMREGKTLAALALVGVQGVALKREMQVIVSYLGQGDLAEAVVLASHLPRSPWYYKAPLPKKPPKGWKEISFLLEALKEDVRALEAAFNLRNQASWPEVRFLQVLNRLSTSDRGKSGTPEAIAVTHQDLAFAVQWLWKKREIAERLGCWQVEGPFVPLKAKTEYSEHGA